MPEVVIVGAGAFARVATVYLEADSPYTVSAFAVHERYIDRTELLGRPVVALEHVQQSHPPTRFRMLVAVGFRNVNRVRAGLYNEAKSRGYELISYISSKATRYGHIAVGDNCFIFEHNVLQPFVSIGNDVILWSGNHVGHDVSIGDHCFIASHVVLSGHVTVGDYTFVGVNATVRDGVKIAPRCVIGAGALILSDTIEEGVYAAKGSEVARVPSSRLRGL